MGVRTGWLILRYLRTSCEKQCVLLQSCLALMFVTSQAWQCSAFHKSYSCLCVFDWTLTVTAHNQRVPGMAELSGCTYEAYTKSSFTHEVSPVVSCDLESLQPH